MSAIDESLLEDVENARFSLSEFQSLPDIEAASQLLEQERATHGGDGGGGGNDSKIVNSLEYASTAVHVLLNKQNSEFCFDLSAFSQDAFEAREFVKKVNEELRDYSAAQSGLEILRSDLKRYADKLKAQLIDLLNRDYADFISLSSSLVGTSESINNITMHIAGIKDRLTSISLHVQLALQEVEQQLQEKERIASRRHLLETLQDIHQTLVLIKQLLKQSQSQSTVDAAHSHNHTHQRYSSVSSEVDSMDNFPARAVDGVSEDDAVFAKFTKLLEEESQVQTPEDALKNQAILLERLARQFAFLRVLVKKGESFTMVQHVLAQVDNLQQQFEGRLESVFLQAINLHNKDAIEASLRAFAFSEKKSDAESIVAEKIVRPFVVKEVTRDRIERVSRAPLPTRQREQKKIDSEPLSLIPMYDSLFQCVRDKCGLLLACSLDSVSPFYFDFLGNAIWKEISHALVSFETVLCKSGIAEIFHRNYSESARFLAQLESWCDTDEALLRFRSHASSVAFRSKWNLDIYYNLRSKHLALQLDQVLASATPSASYVPEQSALIIPMSPAADSFSLYAVRVLWSCLESSWSPSVFLHALGAKFFDLTLRLLNDFLLWLEAGLKSVVHSSTAENKQPPRAASLSSASTPADETKRAAWPNLSVDDLICIQADIVTLRDKIINTLEPLIVFLLMDNSSSVSPNTLASAVDHVRNELSLYNEDHSHVIDPVIVRYANLVSAGIHGCQERFSHAFDLVREQIVFIIAQECSAQLQAVAGINKNYQMTNRKPPTTASPYVNNILQPLKAALDGNVARVSEDSPARLSAAYRHQLCLEVCEAVATRFIAVVKELLSIVQRTESSLNSLKRLHGQKTAQNTGDAMSDSDKIRLQVSLDVKEFKLRVQAFEVPHVNAIDELEELVKLPTANS